MYFVSPRRAINFLIAVSYTHLYLELAGCTTIFEVSSYTGEGVEALSQGFHDMVNKYREENKGRYADDYFD